MIKELKPVYYGLWKIRVRRTLINHRYFYEYKIEVRGNDISRGWISVPYGSNKELAVAYAKEAIDTNYSKKVLISESGGILQSKYDQFRGYHYS